MVEPAPNAVVLMAGLGSLPGGGPETTSKLASKGAEGTAPSGVQRAEGSTGGPKAALPTPPEKCTDGLLSDAATLPPRSASGNSSEGLGPEDDASSDGMSRASDADEDSSADALKQAAQGKAQKLCEAGRGTPEDRQHLDKAIAVVARVHGDLSELGDAAAEVGDEALLLWQHIVDARANIFEGFPSPQPPAGLDDWTAPACPSAAEWAHMKDNEEVCFGFFRVDEEQQAKVKDLAERLSTVSCIGCRWNERFVEILRYLRNCDFDVAKTEAKVRENAAWRQEEGVDTILDSYLPPFSVLKHYGGWGLEVEDHDGFPVFTWKIGKSDIIGLLRTYSPEDIVRYAIWEREWFGRVLAYRRATDPEKDMGYGVKVMIIADLEGLGMRHFSGNNLDAFSRIMGMDQQRYPEAGFRTLVVRAPRLFSAIFGIVRSLFQNQDEILIRSGDPQSVLAKYMAPDDIPDFLGGNNGEISSPAGTMTTEDVRRATLEKEGRDSRA